MLLQLSQQWRRPSMSDRRSRPCISLDLSQTFIAVWQHALLSKLSAHGIQGQLHSWISDFLPFHRQCVALNGTLSSPLPVKAGEDGRQTMWPIKKKLTNLKEDLTGNVPLSFASICTAVLEKKNFLKKHLKTRWRPKYVIDDVMKNIFDGEFMSRRCSKNFRFFPCGVLLDEFSPAYLFTYDVTKNHTCSP